MKTYPLAYQNQQHQLKLQPKLKQQRRRGRLLQQSQQQNVKKEKHHKVCKEETDVALVVGRAAWWIPVLATNNNMRNLTFAEALRDFLQNVSFHCYGKLVETGRCYQERLFWLIFHAAALSALVVVLWHNPTTEGQLLRTTLQNSLYPISKVPFPAVYVCSVNRISNAAALRHAEELNKRDPYHRGVQYFYDMMKLLQYNYHVPHSMRDLQKAVEFQQFLDFFDRNDSELLYDTRKRMAMLTPKCSDIVQQCHLGGKEINCTQEFREKFTSYGLCCAITKHYKNSEERSFLKQYVGPNMGLTLVLKAPQEDNYYQIHNINGFIVGLHVPFLTPDLIPGGSERNFALTGSDLFFAIEARIDETTKAARIYNAKARNCLFRDELPAIYGNEYSFDNCITRCRLHSVFTLCGCFPFQTDFENISIPTEAVICNLQHKQCLMRYDFKWVNVITQRQNIRGLEREMEDALYCPNCLPACSEIRYKAHVMTLPLNDHSLGSTTSLRNHYGNYSDLALVRIYFETNKAVYYKRVLNNSWFEMFSKVGNICGIIAGVSLIGVCEVIFFFVKQFSSAYRKEVLCEGHPKATGNQVLQILP